jgi:hypothetical protein
LGFGSGSKSLETSTSNAETSIESSMVSEVMKESAVFD